ncbi:uncharacterized protein PAC_07200 [Phialocephala subalpina]|uniref:Heterokaryon incompatibility domain-containing protein n=1 Tax=Phialocephala subalpina TaxID=576137 RepID=A0A1L7WX08_9HELO|nr:uncharacterized protein PAC_07200 [Phialocephala subalpina]
MWEYDIHHLNSNEYRSSYEDSTSCQCSTCRTISVGISLHRPGIRWTSVLKKKWYSQDNLLNDGAFTIQYFDCEVDLDFFVESAQKREPTRPIFELNSFYPSGDCPSEFPEDNPNVLFHASIRNLGDTGSDTSLARARAWLRDCTTNHQACSKLGRESKLPHQVLDLQPLDQYEANVRLVETGDNHHNQYVCLSHCWGTVVPLKTTRENISALKERIAWNDLPKTFQETVLFTRKLGLRWLWIDSLCIIQNDDLDWKAEAGNMGNVYSNGFLTIAASKARNSADGLFTEKPGPAALVCQTSSENKIYNIFVQKALKIPHESRWRPNPFQELQGHRIIEKDTLPALAGIARAFHEAKYRYGRYIAGYWENDLLLSLVWTCKEQHPQRTEITRVKRDKRLPSWSWASSNLEVCFQVCDAIEKSAKVHSANFSLADPDPFGEIEYANLDLEGDVLAAVITSPTECSVTSLSEKQCFPRATVSLFKHVNIEGSPPNERVGLLSEFRIIKHDEPKSEWEQNGQLLHMKHPCHPYIWMDASYQESYQDQDTLHVLLFPLGIRRGDHFKMINSAC